MTTKKIFAALVLVAIVALTVISSCKKTTNSQPLEPISLVQPDTVISRHFGGDSFTVEIKFTTDRPINWIMGQLQWICPCWRALSPVYSPSRGNGSH